MLITLLGMAFAVLMTLVVLGWLALFIVFASLRWLLTGKKPQVVMMWQQVQTMRKGMQSGQGARWSGGFRWSSQSDAPRHEEPAHTHRSSSKSDVIEDVEVREIREKRYLPKD
ncbi:hypothetical protein B9Z42_08280 [Limnohabitans sp. B9-3]|nr:hypothetical protein B9Z42_08280 [Limnohabitans sp. B9-3]